MRGADIRAASSGAPFRPAQHRRPAGNPSALPVTGTLNVLVAARDNDCQAGGLRRLVISLWRSSRRRKSGDYEVQRRSRLMALPSWRVNITPPPSRTATALETVSLRYFNVFGPRQDPTSDLRRRDSQIHHGDAATANARSIFGDGQAERATSPISTMWCRAICWRVLRQRLSARPINLAAGGRIALIDLVAQLNTIMETALPPIHTAERPGRYQTFACEHRKGA